MSRQEGGRKPHRGQATTPRSSVRAAAVGSALVSQLLSPPIPLPPTLVSTQQREVQVQLLVYDTPQNHLIWSQSQVLSLTNNTLHNLVHVLLLSPSQSIQHQWPPSSFLNSKVCSCLGIFAFTISSTCSSLPSHIQDYLPHFLISFRCLLKCYVAFPPNIPIL